MNPLLDFSGLPRFAEIQPAHVTPAVDQLIAENKALVERLASAGDVASWDEFVAPLDDANERLSRAWGQVAHLNAVMNSPALREVYKFKEPDIEHFWLHSEVDIEHGGRAFDLLVKHCKTREQKDMCIHFARESAKMRWFHFDGIFLHYEMGYALQ